MYVMSLISAICKAIKNYMSYMSDTYGLDLLNFSF